MSVAETEVEHSWRGLAEDDAERVNFISDLKEFMSERGTPLPPVPKLGKKDLDLYALYKEVTHLGGLERVIENKSWKSIVDQFPMPTACTNPAYTLRVNYLRYLYPYERRYLLGILNDPVINYAPSKRPSVASASSSSQSSSTTSSSSTSNSSSAVDSQPAPTPSTIKRRTTDLTQYQSMAPAPQPKSTRITFEYGRTDQPLVSDRLQREISDSHMQLKLALALESKVDQQVEWAINSLVLYSHSGSLKLQSPSRLLDVLLSMIRCFVDRSQPDRIDLSTLFFKSPDPLFDRSRRIMSIVRNLSQEASNATVLATSPACIELLIRLLICENVQLALDARETLVSLSKHLILPSAEGLSRLFLESVVDVLFQSMDEDGIRSSMQILSYLSKFEENQPSIESILLSPSDHPMQGDSLDANRFISRVVQFLCHPNAHIASWSLKTLNHLSKYGPRVKVMIAHEPGCIRTLVNLLSHKPGDRYEAAAHKAADTLMDLATEKPNHELYSPYEPSFAHIWAAESSLSEIILEILSLISETNE